MPVHDADTHEKVKIESVTPYGCSNKLQIYKTYTAQDGWHADGTAKMANILVTSSKLCRYDKRPTDPRCGECKLPSDEEYLMSYGL